MPKTPPHHVPWRGPTVKVIGSHSANAALQAARETRAPIIVQFSSSGALFFGGKFLDDDHHQGSVAGADRPNKQQIDPRAWLHLGQKSVVGRLVQAYRDLNSWQKLRVG